MPPLRWSQPALLDLARLRVFLVASSPGAGLRAVQVIRQGTQMIGRHPQIGRPIEELPPEFREWVVEFGSGAYIVLYRYNGVNVVILAVRHGREAGY